MDTQTLITRVEAYASDCGIAPATVISRAVSNGRLYGRLKDGKTCTLRVAERIQRYMADNPPVAKADA